LQIVRRFRPFRCSFSDTGDNFREEDLFGVQTHGVPQTIYNTFYVQNVRGNTKIQMRNFQLITCAPHTCVVRARSSIQYSTSGRSGSVDETEKTTDIFKGKRANTVTIVVQHSVLSFHFSPSFTFSGPSRTPRATCYIRARAPSSILAHLSLLPTGPQSSPPTRTSSRSPSTP